MLFSGGREGGCCTNKIVVLASEPVGGRSWATELPICYINMISVILFTDPPLISPGMYHPNHANAGPNLTDADIQAQYSTMEKHYRMQADLLSRQFDEQRRMLAHEQMKMNEYLKVSTNASSDTNIMHHNQPDIMHHIQPDIMHHIQPDSYKRKLRHKYNIMHHIQPDSYKRKLRHKYNAPYSARYNAPYSAR